MSAIAGRVLLIPKGNYDSATTYTMLDMVVYNGSSYICKQECTGVVPTNTTYWMLNASGSAVAYINDIGDVVITNPTNGQVLMYNSTTQKWVNGTLTLNGLNDTQFASLSDGQVLKYNATTQKWENAEDTGGILPHLIIISETGESVVKAVKGTTEIIATETSTGHYECDVPEFGTWTIHAVLNGDDATVNLVVDTVKVYTVDDSHFHADITVKYPSGATCNLAGQGESYYATGSPYTFTVHHAGQYTITVVYDGQTYTDSVTVTTTGETFSKVVPSPSSVPANDINWWIFFGDVSGTFTTLEEILANSTALTTLMASTDAVDYLVRCKEWITNKGLVPVMISDTTPSGTVISSGEITNNEAYHVFDGIAPQTSSGDIWVPTTTGQATWVGYDFGTPIQVNKVMINNTSWYGTYRAKDVIVEASNDLSTWTPISETLTLAQNSNDQIFTFDNNVSYRYWRFHIVSSYDATNNWFIRKGQFYKFADSIPENANAMTYIGLNNYCANTLLADADWLDGICDSEYFESVLNVKVPTMTSNTTPSGECFASSNANNAYLTFDGDNDLRWYPTSNSTNNYVGYKFTSSKKIIMTKITYGQYGTFGEITFKLQGSTNGTNYTDIDTFTLPSHSGESTVVKNLTKYMSNNNSYTYYRLFTSDIMYVEYTYIEDFRITQFYGREDV